MTRLTSVVVVLAVFLCSGCASIVSGHNQSVSVTTASEGRDVSGAKCSLVNDKGSWFATTPGSVTVRRSYDDLTINCTGEGLPTGIATVKSSTKGMAFGNILFGGIIGVGVDMGTGAAYDYPSLIPVSMGRALRIEVDAKGTLLSKDMSDPKVVAVAQTTGSRSVVAQSQTTATPAIASLVPQPGPLTSSTAQAAVTNAPAASPLAQTLPGSSTGASSAKTVSAVLVAKDNGQDGYQAERFAKEQTCKAARASLVTKGAGYETHAVSCEGSETLMVRCEFGNCRLLK